MISGFIPRVEYNEIIITGVSIDSREIEKGNLFIPILGTRDGHDFVAEAIERGAGAVLWDRSKPNPPSDIPLIFVNDTLLALQDLARTYREQLSVKVIGVTGSNGKTTTKDMISSILEISYKVHKTKGNYNSQIGLPLSILKASKEDEILILELGMSEKDQIGKLSKIAQPDIAAITMIGTSHLVNLGSRKEIANAKMEILDGLKDEGLFIYPKGEPLLINEKCLRSVTFGETGDCDLYFTTVDSELEDQCFHLNAQEDTVYAIPILGKHNIQNALIAIAIAKELGISEENIIKGLANVTVTEMRMQKYISKQGFTIIDDSYNASPDSVKSAIEALHDVKGYKNKYLILGDMLELGEEGEKYHWEIGEYIRGKNIDILCTYGPLSSYISRGAAETMSIYKARNFPEKRQIIEFIKKTIKEEDIVLVKGSRGMKMEEIIEGLL
jgi:UDP-N-acetylmuramoyl-tripeptide--D-alanyl-D-alanine ligase